MVKQKIKILAFVLGMVFFLTNQSLAMCIAHTQEERIKSADIIFVGKVNTIVKNPTRDSERYYMIEFEIIKRYKGLDLIKTDNFTLETNDYGSSTSVSFQENEEYLVFAVKESDGRYDTTQCIGTKLSSEAADDLNVLQKLNDK